MGMVGRQRELYPARQLGHPPDHLDQREADRVAQRIAIIDHGRIVAIGSPRELKEQTGKESLEEAFLALTGTTIRDETAGSVDQMRQFAKMWRR